MATSTSLVAAKLKHLQ